MYRAIVAGQISQRPRASQLVLHDCKARQFDPVENCFKGGTEPLSIGLRQLITWRGRWFCLKAWSKLSAFAKSAILQLSPL